MRLLPLGRVCFREPHAESEGNAVMLEPQRLDFSSATAGCGVVGNIAKHSAKPAQYGHGESPVPEAALMPRNSLNPSGDGSR